VSTGKSAEEYLKVRRAKVVGGERQLGGGFSNGGERRYFAQNGMPKNLTEAGAAIGSHLGRKPAKWTK
jgi:hypothetical protein